MGTTLEKVVCKAGKTLKSDEMLDPFFSYQVTNKIPAKKKILVICQNEIRHLLESVGSIQTLIKILENKILSQERWYSWRDNLFKSMFSQNFLLSLSCYNDTFVSISLAIFIQK